MVRCTGVSEGVSRQPRDKFAGHGIGPSARVNTHASGNTASKIVDFQARCFQESLLGQETDLASGGKGAAMERNAPAMVAFVFSAASISNWISYSDLHDRLQGRESPFRLTADAADSSSPGAGRVINTGGRTAGLQLDVMPVSKLELGEPETAT